MCVCFLLLWGGLKKGKTAFNTGSSTHGVWIITCWRMGVQVEADIPGDFLYEGPCPGERWHAICKCTPIIPLPRLLFTDSKSHVGYSSKSHEACIIYFAYIKLRATAHLKSIRTGTVATSHVRAVTVERTVPHWGPSRHAPLARDRPRHIEKSFGDALGVQQRLRGGPPTVRETTVSAIYIIVRLEGCLTDRPRE